MYTGDKSLHTGLLELLVLQFTGDAGAKIIIFEFSGMIGFEPVRSLVQMQEKIWVCRFCFAEKVAHEMVRTPPTAILNRKK